MRILMTVEYKGTNFSGWQIQPNRRTVQGEIETALSTLFGQSIAIFGSGRTDSGVHALGQTAHFEVARHILSKFMINSIEKTSNLNKNEEINNKKQNSKLDKNKLIMAINANLPNDIKILNMKKVASHFHARFNVKEKIYLYKLQMNTNTPSPLLNGFVGTCKKNLAIEKMHEGAKYLIGEHNFISFSSSKTEVEDFVRTINYIKIKKESDFISFEISGNGFLYNMVRIIVGTLVDVGTNKIDPQDVKAILEAKDRTKAGKTVSASGLYLKKVRY